MPFNKWITCEEVVKRSINGKKHGYIFEIDAHSPGPVPATPVLEAGRMVHEATAWRNGILYETEDRTLDFDPVLGRIGACLYRFIPDRRACKSRNLASGGGVLQALKLRNETHADMDAGREIGKPFPVEWVTVDEPDHEDDSDNRRDRVPGYTPTRIQAQDKGAAFFDRLEGMWAVGHGSKAKIYFDCTTGGAANLGQVWEYDIGREAITLIYESRDAEALRNPDNIVVVPQTRDIFLCEDAGGTQFIRGLTPGGAIYDFARTNTNQTEFCGACFDRSGHTLFVNQQGFGGSLPDGPPGANAVTYAIYGPFNRRH
jgi:secreted PhoX family phosphatase